MRPSRTKFLLAFGLAAAILAAVFSIADANATTDSNQKSILSKEKKPSPFQDGDIIFQSSTSGQSLAIQLATHSKYSHVGIIYMQDGKPVVFEAVQPVKITPLKEFISHGDGGKYVVKRLKDHEKYLTPEAMKVFKQEGTEHLGKNYDLYFEWSDDRIYCSELVWKLYKEATGLELGQLKPLNSYDLSSPEVQRIMRQRYGDSVPKDEMMISPGAIFESELLEVVVQE